VGVSALGPIPPSPHSLMRFLIGKQARDNLEMAAATRRVEKIKTELRRLPRKTRRRKLTLGQGTQPIIFPGIPGLPQ
jgi:hypothetical protein